MMVNTHVVRINGCGLFIHSRSLLNPGAAQLLCHECAWYSLNSV